LPSKLTRVFEKVADEGDLPTLKLEPRDPFVFVTLLLSTHPLIAPMNRNSIPLGDNPLDLEVQFRILPEEDLKELDDPRLADERLSFWKRKRVSSLRRPTMSSIMRLFMRFKKLGG